MAQTRSVRQLAGLYDHAKGLVGTHNASIFAIYAMLIEDDDYQNRVYSFILSQNVTAEYAVFLTGEEYAAAFSGMEDEYMCARASDMRNVSRQVIDDLTDHREPDPLGMEPAILVADEFSPSRTLMLDRRRLTGLVSRQGSTHSHAAELACALQIPSLVHADIPPELDGHLAILDSADHQLYVDPTPEIFGMLEEKTAQRQCASC